MSAATYPVHDRPRLAAVVPLFEEHARLEGCVSALTEALTRAVDDRWELILVDDGSSDGTGAAARELASTRTGIRVLAHPENRGKGAALRTGVAASTADEVLLCDADLSVDLKALPMARRRMAQGADLVIGDRTMPGARIVHAQSRGRELAGRTFSTLARLATGVPDSDLTCGFKLGRGTALRRVFRELRVERWAYDAELLWRARRGGLRVAPIQVVWSHGEASKVRPWRDGLGALRDLARVASWRSSVESAPDARPLTSPDAGPTRL